jgi:hypothetical protein
MRWKNHYDYNNEQNSTKAAGGAYSELAWRVTMEDEEAYNEIIRCANSDRQ